MRTGPQTYSAGARVRHRDPEAAPLAGFASRKLTAFFNLGPGDVRNLSFLYFATFIMRAAAFAGVAVMQDVMHSLDPLWRGVLFAVYPLAEIATVGYLGALCDRIGRKRILVFAHLVTAAAVFLFILSIGVDPAVQPYLVAVFFAMFGIGAAAKVASTLAMINDHSNRANRAAEQGHPAAPPGLHPRRRALRIRPHLHRQLARGRNRGIRENQSTPDRRRVPRDSARPLARGERPSVGSRAAATAVHGPGA